MKRFSVAVSDDLLAKIDEIAECNGQPGKRPSWSRPWSRDRTAAWLLDRAVSQLQLAESKPARSREK